MNNRNPVNLINSSLSHTHITNPAPAPAPAPPAYAIAKYYPQIVHSFGQNGILFSPVQPDLDQNGQKYSALFEAKTEHFADQPQIRNFILYTVELFARAQKEYKKYYPEPVPQITVSQISLGYRSAIMELVQTLKNSGEDDLGLLYSHLDCVWHFCEIMFITSHPELSILPYYMDWIKVNFGSNDDVLYSLLSSLPDLDDVQLQELWNVIYTQIFHGRCLEAEKLLEYTNLTGSAVVQNQLSLMSELLKKKPIFDPALTSLSDFSTKWQIWQEECENRIENLAFSGHEQLTFIARLISGQEEAFLEAKEHIPTWFEYLCLILNYKYPTTLPGSLKAYARKAIEDYGNGTIVLTPLEEILMAAMDSDIVTVLKEMMNYWNHPWFALHFSDLIFTGGIWSAIAESRIDYKAVGLIRTDLVREYGIDIMQHHSVWEVGVKYLQSLPAPIGLPIICELIQRKKPTSDIETNKIISVASKFNFKAEVNSICREVALRKYKEGLHQNALLWAMRGNDTGMTGYLVDALVQDGTISIAPTLTDLLPNFTVYGNRLIFLNGYFQFNNLMQDGKILEAMSVFCRLIELDVIPKYAGPKMLLSIFDVRNQDIQLGSKEIQTLLQFLHTKIGKKPLGSYKFGFLTQILHNNRTVAKLEEFNEARCDLRPKTSGLGILPNNNNSPTIVESMEY